MWCIYEIFLWSKLIKILSSFFLGVLNRVILSLFLFIVQVMHEKLIFFCIHIHITSLIPFSSCPQSLPASESFPVSQLFAWGGQSTGVSALASFLPKKFHIHIHNLFKRLSQLQCYSFESLLNNSCLYMCQSFSWLFISLICLSTFMKLSHGFLL